MVTTATPNVERFRQPQREHLDQVTSELQAGRKRTHWMWFMFPQVEGLGGSETARTYSLHSLAEAEAFFSDPEYSKNYWSLLAIVHGQHHELSMDAIFRRDARKLRSSLTVFLEVSAGIPGSAEALSQAGDLLETLRGPCPFTVAKVKDWRST